MKRLNFENLILGNIYKVSKRLKTKIRKIGKAISQNLEIGKFEDVQIDGPWLKKCAKDKKFSHIFFYRSSNRL